MKSIKLEGKSFLNLNEKIDGKKITKTKKIDYIIFDKDSIVYKLTNFDCQSIKDYQKKVKERSCVEEKLCTKCVRGNHGWVAVDLDLIINAFKDEKQMIDVLKLKRDTKLLPMYHNSNYLKLKNAIINYKGEFKINSSFLKFDNPKSDYKYWKYDMNQKIWYLFKIAFGMRVNCLEQIIFVKELLKVDKGILNLVQIDILSGKNFEWKLKEKIKIFNKFTKEEKKKTNQRLSFMEIDVVILYALCIVFPQLEGWYVPNIKTIFDKIDGEEIALLDFNKNIKCYKKLKLGYYSK